MATIRLYGHLERFGAQYQLEVRDAAEAVKALVSQMPGLREAMAGHDYQIIIDGQPQDEMSLKRSAFQPLAKDSEVHIIPIIAGAGGGGSWLGPLKSIAAAAVSWFVNPILSLNGLVGVAYYYNSQRVTQPKQNDNGNDNQYFGSTSNSTAQGSCVPLIYGKPVTGSKLLSQGTIVE